MDKKYGVLLVILTAIISGFSIFINKYSVSKIEPYTFTFIKNIIVGLFLVGLILLTKEINAIKYLKKKEWFLLILIGLVGGSIPFLLFFKGLSITSAAAGSFIHKTIFIFASILAIIFLKEKIPRKLYFVAILLLIGNFLVLRITNLSFGVGELLILLATLCWAVENILSKYALKTLSGNLVACGRILFGSVFIFIFLIMTNKLSSVNKLNSSDIIWTLFTSILLLGFVVTYYNGLKYIKVSTATSILLLGSPVTTILSISFSGATALISESIGISLIVICVIALIFVLEISKKQSITFQQRSRSV